MSTSNPENDILHIAQLVADAQDEEVPPLLSKLTVLLQKHPVGSSEYKEVRKVIWKYDLLSWCAVALSFDYTNVNGGFELVSNISEIFCDCCCSVNVNESQEFVHDVLPAAVASLLKLIHQLQQHIIQKIKIISRIKKTAADIINIIFDHLVSLVTAYPQTCAATVGSPDLLRIIMEDENTPELVMKVCFFIHRVIKLNRHCISQCSDGTIQSLLDELVYKLTSSSNKEIVHMSTRLIVAIANQNNKLVPVMVMRFKGLKAVLSRWKGHGFDHDLSQLSALFEAGTAERAELIRKNNAATTIWAYYIGWKTRSRIKKLHKAVPILQRKFRQKREKNFLERNDVNSQSQSKTTLKFQRQLSLRRTHEKQLHALEIVPANKIGDHIQNEENAAAIRIQSHFRAYHQRKNYHNAKVLKKQNDAATIIQRRVRKYLSKKKPVSSQSADSQYNFWNDEINDEVRNQLLLDIGHWQAANKRLGVTRKEAMEVHVSSQKLYYNHCLKEAVDGVKFQSLEALLAKIHTEEDVLKHLPSLTNASRQDVMNLASSNNAVRIAAAQQHRAEMNKIMQPWWKKLNSSGKEEVNIDNIFI